MFYSQYILSKKGPLGTIWIAAHLDRKLRKTQVAETNIGETVDSILFPEAPIALRLSGHLLLGVVRIYSRKVNYLFHDCSEALVKIKQAFHSTVVDLSPDAATAPYHSITLPETFDLDELELLPNFENSFLSTSCDFVDHHVTTREQITLQDPMEGILYIDSQIGPDERFADGDALQTGLDFDEDIFTENINSIEGNPSSLPVHEDMPPPICSNRDDASQDETEICHEPSSPLFRAQNDFTAVEGKISTFATLLDPLERPVNKAASLDVTPFANSKLSFTPFFEARTPDLNLEFCPLAEPSTPALPDEKSTATFQETCSPGPAEGFDKCVSGPQTMAIESIGNSNVALLHPEHDAELPLHISEGSLPKDFYTGVSVINSQQQLASPDFLLSNDANRSTNQETSTIRSLQQLNVAVTSPEFLITEGSHMFSEKPSQGFIASRFGVNRDFQLNFPMEPMHSSNEEFVISSMQASASTCHYNTVAPSLQPFDASMPNVPHTCVVTSTNYFPCAASEQIPSLLIQPHIGSVIVTGQAAGTIHMDDISSISQNSTFNLSISVKEHSSVQSPSHIDIHTLSMSNKGQSDITASQNSFDFISSQDFSFPVETQGLGISPFPLVSLTPHSTVKDKHELQHHMIHISHSRDSLHLPYDQYKDAAALEHGSIPITEREAYQDIAEEGQHAFLPLALFSMNGEIPSSVDGVNHTQGYVVKTLECEKLKTSLDSQSKLLDSSDYISSLMDMRPCSEKVDTPAYKHKNTEDNVRLYTAEKSHSLWEDTFFDSLSLPFSSKRLEPAPEDDVLATILLGTDESLFKVVPVLQRNHILKRPNTRTGTHLCNKKPKILDTSTMLHGDVTQQLENMEDICRLPKKAPCTRREIWALEIESQGQQCLFEPTYPELPIELHELYDRVYGSNGALLPLSDTAVASSPNQPVIERDLAMGDTKLEHAVLQNDQENSPKVPVAFPGLGKQVTNPVYAGHQQDGIVSSSASEPQEIFHGGPLGNAPIMNETIVGKEFISQAEVLKRRLINDRNVQDVEQASLLLPITSSLKGECATSEVAISHGNNNEYERVDKESVRMFVRSELEILNVNRVLPFQQSPEQHVVGGLRLSSEDKLLTSHLGSDVQESLTAECQATGVDRTQEICWDILQSRATDMPQNGIHQEEEMLEGDVDNMKNYGSRTVSLCNSGVLVCEESEVQDVFIRKKAECIPETSLRCSDIYSFRKSQSTGMEDNQTTPVDSVKCFVDDMTRMEEIQIEPELPAEETGGIQEEFPQECTEEKMVYMEIEERTAFHAVMKGKLGFNVVGAMKESLNGKNMENAIGIPLKEETKNQVCSFDMNEKDIEFLAVEDEDEASCQETYMDTGDRQDMMLTGNAGWSTRTRNVAKYLKTVFERLEDNCRETDRQENLKLTVGQLLVGKKRKEAARMFFETLVLKSKDCLHVEQPVPFDDIYIRPRTQLLKANFFLKYAVEGSLAITFIYFSH